MKTDINNPSKKSWRDRTLLLRWMILVAFGVILTGFVISISIRAGGWPSSWDDLVLSSLASPRDNPNGWLVAVVSASLGGILLLMSALLINVTFCRLRSRWGALGTLLYCLGVLAIITWAISTPLAKGPSSFHVYLAYFAYMSSLSGLGICHSVIAFMLTKGWLWSAGSGLLLTATLFLLIYFFFHDDIFDHHLWLLAVTEWIAGVIIATTTAILSLSVHRLASFRRDAN